MIEQYGGVAALGGPHTAPHFAAAWAHAMNTPFQWGKQTASHLGGTRDPMVVAWPSRIKAGGDLRPQFTHVIDVGPTILEAAGIPQPKLVDGIAQEPMDGTSFLYSFADAKAAERHTTQYFEMFGSRGIYKDGWWAASRPNRIPWDVSPETLKQFGPQSSWDPDRDTGWELYNLADDFSQAKNVAAQNPDKVKELQELWWSEAERNRVLPLMAGMSVMYGILPPLPTVTRFTFAGDVQNIQRGMIPRIQGRSYSIEAELAVPKGGAEGVIVANADFIGGFSLWVDEDAVRGRPAQAGDRRQGDAVGERQADRRRPPRAHGADRLHVLSGMDIGRDNGLVVDLPYESKAPYVFTGTVKNVAFDLKPEPLEAEVALHEHAALHAVAAGVAG